MNVKKYLDKIVAVYESGETDFHIGKLVASDEETAVLNMITTRGFEDGLYCMKNCDITRVDSDDKYLQKYTRLFGVNKQEFVSDFSPKDDVFTALLNYAFENAFVTTFEIEYEDRISGKIASVTEETVIVEKIDDYGESDGISEIDISSVSRMVCNSGTERLLEALQK